MVGRRPHTALPQRPCRRVGILARRGIHQRPALADETREQSVLLAVTRHGPHDETDIRAVEPCGDDARLAQSQQLDDVVADFRRGRGGEGRDRRATRSPVAPAARSRRVAESAILRPEIVPPLRHAVRLIDDPRHGNSCNSVTKADARNRSGATYRRCRSPCVAARHTARRSSADSCECSAAARMPRCCNWSTSDTDHHHARGEERSRSEERSRTDPNARAHLGATGASSTHGFFGDGTQEGGQRVHRYPATTHASSQELRSLHGEDTVISARNDVTCSATPRTGRTSVGSTASPTVVVTGFNTIVRKP